MRERGKAGLGQSRERVSPLHSGPSSLSPTHVLLKDVIVPVPAGAQVPYLYVPLAWTPFELWCLLL